MRNLLKKATLGVALGAAALTTAAPAEAQRWHRGYRGHDRTGPAIVAGIAGLAVGAAIASSNRDRYYDRRYYNDGYYDRGGYDRGYYYDRPYRGGYYDRCYVRRVYDPYIGRHVRVRYC